MRQMHTCACAEYTYAHAPNTHVHVRIARAPNTQSPQELPNCHTLYALLTQSHRTGDYVQISIFFCFGFSMRQVPMRVRVRLRVRVARAPNTQSPFQ